MFNFETKASCIVLDRSEQWSEVMLMRERERARKKKEEGGEEGNSQYISRTGCSAALWVSFS